MRLVFAGTPAAAVPSLRALLDSPRHDVVAVITRPAATAGRGRRAVTSPVEQLAHEAALPFLTPARAGDPAFLTELAELAPDCCPVVAYGALLPPTALTVPTRGWVNLHFSLLPAWRGAAPVQRAILGGDEITGASTFLIEAGLDTGPVFGVITEAIKPTDTAGDLLERLATSGAHLLLATMDGIEDGTLVPAPQSPDGVSTAAKLNVDDARVDWSVPAFAVDRRIRACTPAPGAWTTFRGERLKLGPVRPVESAEPAGPTEAARRGEHGEPGEITPTTRSVRVATAAGAVELGLVQPAGKRMIPAPDWARGARLEAGERLA
jgi:methionyl-tRNA formyltransferase